MTKRGISEALSLVICFELLSSHSSFGASAAPVPPMVLL